MKNYFAACMDCPDRVVGCQISCKRYESARAAYDRDAAVERKQRETDRMVENCRTDSILRTQRKKRDERTRGYR